jgi:superfamily II DNA/RNA helicase
MDLYDAGLVSNVKMEIVSSTYDFKATDWQGTYGNLKSTKTNSPKQAEDALVAVCKEMIDKLKNPLKEWYSINNVTKNSIGKLFDYMDKTIIYTHSLSQANKFHKILNSKKELTNKVLVSHSENDPDSIEFNKFKTEDKYKVLIAVDRGRIGFDMPELFNIVDFTMTQNLDMLLQMYGRLLRKSDLQKKKQKIYFKVATKNTADYFVDLMTAMLCLTDMKWYSSYNGKNMGGIKIPKVLTKSIRNKQYQQNQNKSKSKKVKPYVSLTELGIPLDLNLFRQSILHSSNGKFNTIAETTLDDVRREFFNIQIKSDRKEWTIELAIIEAKKYKGRNAFMLNGKGAYQWARKNGVLEEVCQNIKPNFIYWDEISIRKEAMKYNSKNEFANKAGKGPVTAAKRLGIYEDVCKHMKNYFIDWTTKENQKLLINEAKKYKGRFEFANNNRKAFAAAKRYGLIDKLFPERIKRKIGIAIGYKWINNGNISSKIKPNESLPKGWTYGRIYGKK